MGIERRSNGNQTAVDSNHSLDGNEPYRGLSASLSRAACYRRRQRKTPVHTYTSVCMRASHIAHALAWTGLYGDYMTRVYVCKLRDKRVSFKTVRNDTLRRTATASNMHRTCYRNYASATPGVKTANAQTTSKLRRSQFIHCRIQNSPQRSVIWRCWSDEIWKEGHPACKKISHQLGD